MPKKKFTKNNSVTFKLVHRSQKDPLINDDTAPQMVLQECPPQKSDKKDRIEEQRKYGVYFEDDYDYMQHLKSVDELSDGEEAEFEAVSSRDTKQVKGKKKIMLPSSLFPSGVENEEGMLAGALLPVGPQVDWDPDIVAALDDDVDFDDPDNELDDDFVIKAMGGDDGEDDGNEEEESGDEDESDMDSNGLMEEEDDLGELIETKRRTRFDSEETQSCFTSYSMTSSVMRRNKGLALLDEQFETMFEREYGEDTELGALDMEEIEGPGDSSEVLQQILGKNNPRKQRKKDRAERKECIRITREKYLNEDSNEEDNEKELIEIREEGKHCEDRMDCESVISTYSNLYNHPKLIYEPKEASRRIKVNSRTGIPESKPGLTAANLKRLDPSTSKTMADAKSSVTSLLSKLSVRTKDETPEERKARKSLIKEIRRERRQEKKGNRLAFKEEALRQHQEAVNIHQNLSNVRLV